MPAIAASRGPWRWYSPDAVSLEIRSGSTMQDIQCSMIKSCAGITVRSSMPRDMPKPWLAAARKADDKSRD